MSPLILHIIYFAGINLFILVIGYTLIRRKIAVEGWLLMAFAILSIYFIFLQDGPVIRMLSIIATTFSGMKVITTVESYRHQPLTLSFGQWFAFAAGWAGMRAAPFEKLGQAPVPGAWLMIRTGASRIFAGALLLFAGHQLWLMPYNREFLHIIVSVMLLAGLSLILHFGLLGISAGLWRLVGVNTYLLFRQPVQSISLGEFWSKRWNIAFSEMTSIAIFRPLKNSSGNSVALISAFIFSGLLHELALTVPVNSGYGLPLLYFTIQGGVVWVEKTFITSKTTLLQNRIIARSWVCFWLIAPMPLLFNPQFLGQIVWPLAGLHGFN